MNNNCIVIDSDKIDMLIGRVNEMSHCVESSVNQSKNSFSSLKGSSNLSQGIDGINDNLSIMVEKFNKYKYIIEKQSSLFFDDEKMLSAAVDEIELPKELSVVDNIFETKTENINLYKNDGKSINKTNDIFSSSYDEESRINKQELENINNGKEFKQSYYDEKTNINYNNLENINKNIDTNMQEYDESTEIEGKNLENIQNYMNTNEVDYDDSTTINQKQFNSIYNNESEENKYNDLLDEFIVTDEKDGD